MSSFCFPKFCTNNDIRIWVQIFLAREPGGEQVCVNNYFSGCRYHRHLVFDILSPNRYYFKNIIYILSVVVLLYIVVIISGISGNNQFTDLLNYSGVAGGVLLIVVSYMVGRKDTSRHTFILCMDIFSCWHNRIFSETAFYNNFNYLRNIYWFSNRGNTAFNCACRQDKLSKRKGRISGLCAKDIPGKRKLDKGNKMLFWNKRLRKEQTGIDDHQQPTI